MFPRINKKAIYFFVLLIPIVFLFFFQNSSSGLKIKIAETSSWPLRVILFPFKEFKKAISYHKTYDDYQDLKKEADTFKRRLQEQEEVLKENNRLKKLLELKQSAVFSSTAANVIARNPSNWSAAIIIDKGSRDGIEQGMPVVSSLGVIGKIIEVGVKTSKVMLLTDPRFSVAVLIQRNREQGLVSGSLQGLCRMQYLSPDVVIEIGDKVTTSKLSSFFPEGLLIGKVVDVRESLSSPTIECLVEPAVSLSQIEEVIVIKR
ncbi:MAG: rod shape-determining protein MreC [Candidatus Aceula meridiana]|nr:rod shape-determining protein MreC [Candidatus Aceula meridiana]